MAETSAGILMYRRTGPAIEVFLVHPGGPFWAKKDDGAWSIPKGLYDADEPPDIAARREFEEETGFAAEGALLALGAFRQPGGKVVTAYALEGDADPDRLTSNRFTMEWPPKSGRSAEFPEVDRGGWFDREAASRKILKGQLTILDALFAHLDSKSG